MRIGPHWGNARELVLEPATGRTTTRLLPSFETISYGDLWTRVRALAAAWRRDETYPEHSVLPLDAYREPEKPLRGGPNPDRGVSHRSSGSQNWRRQGHSTPVVCADRQVRHRPAAPRPAMTGPDRGMTLGALPGRR
jgi:hypothetical protein